MSILNSDRRQGQHSRCDTQNATELNLQEQLNHINKFESTIKSEDALKKNEEVLDEFIEYKKERIDYKLKKLTNTLELLGTHLDKEINMRHNL